VADIQEQLSQVIVGQNQVIEELLISLFCRGHCLLEGVPGLAKTLMISTLARTLNLTFSRIQFTPDLMPADITGTEIIEENRSTGARERRFLEGPVFSHIIWPTKSTARRPRRRRRCWRPCRSGRSRSAACGTS
jgi:MoxR-like ATPase